MDGSRITKSLTLECFLEAVIGGQERWEHLLWSARRKPDCRAVQNGEESSDGFLIVSIGKVNTLSCLV